MLSFSADRVFPIRLLGFGLYWAWLFLVTVSPSPVFSTVQFINLPAELFELFFRLVFIFVIFGFASRLENPLGRNLLVLIACIAGPAATYLEYLFPTGFPLLAALVLEGLTDASVFVLWLCFFGNMKVGETALYMALSYLIGGLLCIATQLLNDDLLILITMALPTASGLMFHFSNKMYAAQHDSAELFDVKEEGEDEQNAQPYPYLTRLGVALGCTAFVFGACSCCIFFGETQSLVPGVTIESICCLILGVICLIFMKVTKQTQDLCSMYKVVPVLIVLGIVLLSFSSSKIPTIGVGCITLGYLMLEITALNDFCIASKARGLSLIKTFCGARLAITGGLLMGWVIYLLLRLWGAGNPAQILFGIALVVMAAIYTIVFTEKEIFSAHNVAEVQERIERAEDASGGLTETDSRFEEFASHYKLSAREQEIAIQLIRGRNINYIAEELFIAPGTVKTHIHNIYTKVGVHNKMELLDVFENKEVQP